MKAFARICAYCLGKPGAWQDDPWGDVVFKVGKKMFAECDEPDGRVTLKATRAEQAVLLHDPAVDKPPYVGRFWWVRIHVTDARTWKLARRLIDRSYELVSGPRT